MDLTQMDDDELIDWLDEMWDASNMYEFERGIAEAVRRKIMEA